MNQKIHINDETQNAYILFGWEAIEARPNLDPFDGTLRTYPETEQVGTTDVHIKHHGRRGIKASAELDLGLANPEIYYEKTAAGENGKARSVSDRIAAIQKNHPEVTGGLSAFQTCLDIPLFGFVWAKKGESFHRNGAVNAILRPITFHSTNILSLGRNNAFANNGASASGSAVCDMLEYGFFLALFEINIPTLKENIEGHTQIPGGDITPWINLLANGLWRAYTTHRYSSFTQRGQYAKFLLAWNPKDEEQIDPVHPRNLIELLEKKKIVNSVEAKVGLRTVLPPLLKGWQYSKETEAGRLEKDNFLTDIIGASSVQAQQS